MVGGRASAAPPGPGSHALTFRHGEQDRKHRLYIPRAYDAKKPAPLVFAFHGGGPQATDDKTRVRRETYAAGSKGTVAVLIAIEGHGHIWPGRRTPGAVAGPSTKELNAAEVVRGSFREHPKVRP